jgi:hypothetical protein
MNAPTKLPTKLSIREQAQLEVAKETDQKNLYKMKGLLRDRVAAEQVLRGIDMQIADLEQQIADGTA